MSENIEQAFDSLSEQTKKYELALYYVKGDKEKARDMVSGMYHDIYTIKTQFVKNSYKFIRRILWFLPEISSIRRTRQNITSYKFFFQNTPLPNKKTRQLSKAVSFRFQVLWLSLREQQRFRLAGLFGPEPH